MRSAIKHDIRGCSSFSRKIYQLTDHASGRDMLSLNADTVDLSRPWAENPPLLLRTVISILGSDSISQHVTGLISGPKRGRQRRWGARAAIAV